MNCGKIRKTLLESSNLEILTAELAQAKAHLRECATCRDFLQQHETMRRFLKERLGSEKAPASVREEVLNAIAQHRMIGVNISGRRTGEVAKYAVAAAVLLAVALSIFYFIAPFKPNQHKQSIAAELIDDHIRYRLSAQAVEQATTDPTALSQWFNSRLDFVAQIPPLAGFELAGGRLCYLFDRRLALAFYQKPDQWVSLFISRGDGIDLSTMEKIGVSGKVLCRGDGKGYQVVAWKDRDLLYALVSDRNVVSLAASW
ncbi:MAG: anti-sigma factor family protein [bacterium]